jgi:protein arginine kinase activator
MQCEICKKKEATIHLTEIIDSMRTEMHICELCAAEQGIALKSQIPINELLNGLLAVQPTDEQLRGQSRQAFACPKCGFTLEQFREKALLGCPNDYELFREDLSPIISKAHNEKTTHCGKVPSKSSAGTKKQIELANLRQKLEAAVKSEDYETAAKLRDKINQLE